MSIISGQKINLTFNTCKIFKLYSEYYGPSMCIIYN